MIIPTFREGERAVQARMGVQERRNRMNGVLRHAGASGFLVELSQSFGNCPKYIQAREPVYLEDRPDAAPGAAPVVHELLQLDDAARRIVTSADAFFIATAYAGDTMQAGRAAGVDVSHRGGKPGFVRRQLLFQHAGQYLGESTRRFAVH